MDGSTKEKLRVEGNQVMMLNIIVTQKRKDYSEIIKFINTWRRKLEDDSSMQNSKQYANLNDVITDIRKKDAIIKRWKIDATLKRLTMTVYKKRSKFHGS